jgi:3-hydroxyisobutyrate dehydrogenase
MTQTQTLRRIAVIGLGKMGGGVARNLARHPDFDVHVFDVAADAVAHCVDVGATAAAHMVAAVTGADLVITSLPMPADVLDVYTELAPHLAERAIVMDTSTVDPDTARAVADIVGEARFVACLLGKGPAQAESGELPLFVGGPTAALDLLEPVFACIGNTVHRMGSVEAATAFKLVSNLIGMTNLAVLAEGYALCRRAGVTSSAFIESLADTGAWSYQAEVRLPWMIADDFAPRFPVALGLKDLYLTLEMAAKWGLAAPVGAAGMSQLASAVAHGHGASDVNAILEVVDPLRTARTT